MAQTKLWAKVRVKALTEQGKWLLLEIRGLKEGTELVGTLTPDLDRFDFPWEQYGAMLVPGENCEVVAREHLEYAVLDAEQFDREGNRNFWNGIEVSDWMDFETLAEAKAFQKKHGGRLKYGAAVINADESDTRYGDYIIEPFYRNSMKEARAELLKDIGVV